jgi:ribose transport system substrate-binding protein
MSGYSRWITHALAIVIPLLVGGCSKDAAKPGAAAATGTKRIILLNNNDSAYWDAARAGIASASKDLQLADKGFTASMDSNDGTEQGQIEKLRQYGTQSDIVAVIVSPASASNPAIADELKALHDKGLIIGCFDNDLTANLQSVRDFYIGTDNLKAGKVMGTAVKNLAAEGTGYVQFVGSDSQQNAIDRMQGVNEVLGDAYEEKDRRVDDTDASRARDNVRNSIDIYADLGVLIGIWSYNAPAIVDVVKERGVREKFTVACFDAEQSTVQHMADGMIDVLIVQNPYAMGYDSVRCAFLKLTGDEQAARAMFPEGVDQAGMIRDTGLKVVVPQGSQKLTGEMFSEFGDNVEFIAFPDFKAWMTELGLTSS